MQRESAKWLEDVLIAGNDVESFLKDRSVEDYAEDRLLQAAVERKLFIIGEAVTQLCSLFPDVAEKLPGTRDIVAFRNRLAHAYFVLDHSRVYDIAKTDLASLLPEVRKALDQG
jgi:uncharacterized protein with HEPN domain